jgi:hypothetical protein
LRSPQDETIVSHDGRFQAALGKIEFLFASPAKMFFIELIREDFHFLAAITTGTQKRMQTPEFLKTWTMLRCCHGASFLFQMQGWFFVCLQIISIRSTGFLLKNIITLIPNR